MEFITYPILFIACIVWFFSTWEKNKEEAARLKAKDEAEEAAWQREQAYYDGLKERANNGDKQAIELLRFHGYDVRAWGWEPPIAYTDEGRIEQMIADVAARRAQLTN